MRNLKLVVFILFCFVANTYSIETVFSPDMRIKTFINADYPISYSVEINGIQLISNAQIDLLFNGESTLHASGYKSTTQENSRRVRPAVSFKNKEIDDTYNLLRISFQNGSELEFRAYNDGIAYRIITKKDEEVEINEVANFGLNEDYKLWTSPVKGFMSSYEVSYEQMHVSSFPDSMNTYLPLLIDAGNNYKVLITEADLYDYPHMFLRKGAGKNQLEAVFPPFPLETKLLRDRGSRIIKGANYIARTNGNRSFPWRLMMITENDAQLLESNLVYLLSRETQMEDISWIVPGKVSWDWWNASNLYDVDFESGLNTDTYKYFIDFASENGLEYIILDEGWSVSTTDLSQPNPELDLPGLIEYGNNKNVRIILWSTWRALNTQWSVLDNFEEWGIAGIKVDFMDRSDQWMVNFYEKVAREAAKRKLMVDFHGAFKPSGLRRAYPNVVSYEAVQGLEYCKWSEKITPQHDVSIPFIRMACGPMDYTPGAMRNFHTNEYHPVFNRPGSQGTRCHQVALFVIYESGIQMLADSPSNYKKEQETTSFIAQIPVQWDELRVLEAKAGEYVLLARRLGNKWFIGGITNDMEREFIVDLSFLEDKTYQATIMKDGVNAERFAEDYELSEQTISNTSLLKVHMVKGGGFAMRIE